jgi:hypothetical protein
MRRIVGACFAATLGLTGLSFYKQAIALDQGLGVTVPATAIIQLDAAGHAVSISTNTGEPIQPGDMVYVVTSDGVYLP